ncbi:toll/interleukin-1 receptor domain-containing protein [Amycolatopsis sp. lyj-346]|uniref:toll/interleukin-1 receptor domain-containing protein n=1 Tax=Amycolatopsis sp. lyj-346 TaxID=2789289 RepID=UPI00397D7D9C
MADEGKQVFVSYARSDEDIARALKDRLSERNISCFMDTAEIQTGDYWRSKVRKALDSSFILIVVLTSRSVISHEVTFEWAYAMGEGVPVIPVVYEPGLVLPAGLDAVDRLDFVDPLSRQWDRLASRITQEISDNTANIGTLRRFGLRNLVSGRVQLSQKYTVSNILSLAVEGSELLVVGRSLEGWSREFQGIRNACSRKSLRVRMALVDENLDPPSWMIPSDYSFLDLRASVEKFRLMEPIERESEGSFELYTLPNSPLFAFTAFRGADGECGILEVGASLGFDDRRALILGEGEDVEASLLKSLKKVYERIVSERDPIFTLKRIEGTGV